MTTTQEKFTVITVISITCSVVSFFASVVNILLIKSMGKWNGYLAIIWTMEICQMFYDLSFTFFNSYGFNALFIGVQFFGGLSVALWTNVLSLILLHVVVKTKSIDILKYYTQLCFFTIVPAMVMCGLYIGLYNHRQDDKIVFKVYYGLRVTSIAINFVVFLLISYRANLIKSLTPATMTSAEAAIRVLSRRVVYYPVWQAITILPAVAYEHFYGLYDGLNVSTTPQFTSAIIYLMFAPSAGVGYLAIFLVMQPNAYKHFVINLNSLLVPLSCCWKKNVQLEDDKKVNVFDKLDNGLTTAHTSTGRLSQLQYTSENDPVSEDSQLLFDRFRDMTEDDLAREINKRTDSSTVTNKNPMASDSTVSGGRERNSSSDQRTRADNFSI